MSQPLFARPSRDWGVQLSVAFAAPASALNRRTHHAAPTPRECPASRAAAGVVRQRGMRPGRATLGPSSTMHPASRMPETPRTRRTPRKAH